MPYFKKNIEKSARKIFWLFFRSKLYLRKMNNDFSDDVVGVEVLMNYNGSKKLTLYLEKSTIKSIVHKIVDGDDAMPRDNIVYDVIGEMASMIAGNAFSDNCKNIDISLPKKSNYHNSPNGSTLMFTSEFGKFNISLEEVC